MNITILNAEAADLERDMLDACITKALHYGGEWAKIQVYNRVPLDAEPWRNPGWLEYVILVAGINIHAIQRRPGEPVEFHS